MTTPLTENAETNETLTGRQRSTSPFSLRPAWTLALAIPGALVLGGALFAGASLYVGQGDTMPASDEVVQASETTTPESGSTADRRDASPEPVKFEQSLSALGGAEEQDAGPDSSPRTGLGAAGTASGDEPRDVFTTASVASSNPDIAVAESEADIVALEGAMKEKAEAIAVTLDEEDATGEPAPAPSEDEDMREATATEHVNMRAGPENEAEVLAVVPKGARLSASAECPQWCEVRYEGQHGWIYRSFIR